MSSPQWIRTKKRIRIYERDGWRCVWCRARVAHTNDPKRKTQHLAEATLDHVLPRAKGGSNRPSNLVTACHRCNCLRQHRSAVDFAFSGDACAIGIHPYNALDRVIEAMGTELPP